MVIVDHGVVGADGDRDGRLHRRDGNRAAADRRQRGQDVVFRFGNIKNAHKRGVGRGRGANQNSEENDPQQQGGER